MANSIFAACLALSAASVSFAQCSGDWVAGSGTPGFTYTIPPVQPRFVWKMMKWDPDGLGPLPEQLIAAGRFTEAFGVPANDIAAWDGNAWHALGGGLNNDAECLTQFQGELVVGGHFTTAGGIAANHIAAWNGQSWHAFGAGLPDYYTYAVATLNGNLIASNGFTVSRWNGTNWQAIGSASSPVYDLGVFRNELVAVGGFQIIGGVQASGVAAWNGQFWRALANASTGAARGITEYNGELIVTNVLSAGSNNSVCAWNGSFWRVLGVGIPSAGGPMGVYHGDLVVGGVNIQGGIAPSSGLFRWNATQGWRAMPNALYTFDSIQEFRGELCVGGHLLETQYSAFVRWTEPSLCAADFDCSGDVGVSDIFAFVNAWLAGDSRADFNRTGGLNVVDLFDFVHFWYAGCNP